MIEKLDLMELGNIPLNLLPLWQKQCEIIDWINSQETDSYRETTVGESRPDINFTKEQMFEHDDLMRNLTRNQTLDEVEKIFADWADKPHETLENLKDKIAEMRGKK